MKARRSRWLTVGAIAAALLVVTGCARGGATTESDDTGGAAEYTKRTIVFAYITAETFPYHKAAQEFKQIVEEGSDGAITVDLYPAGQLGGERDINESILEGSVQVGIGAGALASLSPIMNIFELPFLINGQEHLGAIINSDALDPVEERLSGSGFHVLDWFSTGDSSIQTVNKPISTPSDLQGVKLRVLENPALIDSLKALGASPTPLPFSEVFTSVQTGVVDGSTVDWGSIVALSLQELITNATDPGTPFLAEPRPVIMSNDYWSQLNDAERELIGSAMKKAAESERANFIEVQGEAIKTVADAGVAFTKVDAEAFISALKPTWQKWAKDLDAQVVLDRIIELRPTK